MYLLFLYFLIPNFWVRSLKGFCFMYDSGGGTTSTYNNSHPFSLPWIHGRLTAGIGVRYSNRFRQSWTVLVTSIHGTARLLAKLSWYGMCYFPWRAFLCVLCSSFVKGFSFWWWWWLWWMMGWDSKNRISFHPLLYPKNTPHTVLLCFSLLC